MDLWEGSEKWRKGASVNINNFLSHEQSPLKMTKRGWDAAGTDTVKTVTVGRMAELLTVKTLLAGQFVIDLSVMILTSNLHVLLTS